MVSQAQRSLSVLVMSTIAFTICFAVWMMFAVIGIPLKATLGLNETEFGLLVATPVLTGSLVRLPLGMLTDKVGGRIVYFLLMLACVVPIWLIGEATQFWQFLVLGLFVGLAGGPANRSKPASPETRLQILTLAIGRLTRAGYLYIGMDHFAKPDDELAVAQRQGRLQRNFQGYSTHPECDMLGLGISAIGRIGPTYSQNVKTLEEYYAALDAGRLPVWRGMVLTKDDLVRRAVIQALACHFRLAIESIELSYLVDFSSYFSTELEDLRRLEEDGLVELQPDWIVVTPKGRLLVRIVCMVFDRYLREHRQRESYSRVI